MVFRQAERLKHSLKLAIFSFSASRRRERAAKMELQKRQKALREKDRKERAARIAKHNTGHGGGAAGRDMGEHGDAEPTLPPPPSALVLAQSADSDDIFAQPEKQAAPHKRNPQLYNPAAHGHGHGHGQEAREDKRGAGDAPPNVARAGSNGSANAGAGADAAGGDNSDAVDDTDDMDDWSASDDEDHVGDNSKDAADKDNKESDGQGQSAAKARREAEEVQLEEVTLEDGEDDEGALLLRYCLFHVLSDLSIIMVTVFIYPMRKMHTL